MKTFLVNSLLLVVLISSICSCKKNHIVTQADLIGKWNEAQPCKSSFGCYGFQFNVDSTFIRNSPTVDSGFFYISNSSIQLYRKGYPVLSQNLFTVTVNTANNINIKNFIPCYGCGNVGQDTYFDLNLQKQP